MSPNGGASLYTQTRQLLLQRRSPDSPGAGGRGRRARGRWSRRSDRSDLLLFHRRVKRRATAHGCVPLQPGRLALCRPVTGAVGGRWGARKLGLEPARPLSQLGTLTAHRAGRRPQLRRKKTQNPQLKVWNQLERVEDLELLPTAPEAGEGARRPRASRCRRCRAGCSAGPPVGRHRRCRLWRTAARANCGRFWGLRLCGGTSQLRQRSWRRRRVGAGGQMVHQYPHRPSAPWIMPRSGTAAPSRASAPHLRARRAPPDLQRRLASTRARPSRAGRPCPWPLWLARTPSSRPCCWALWTTRWAASPSQAGGARPSPSWRAACMRFCRPSRWWTTASVTPTPTTRASGRWAPVQAGVGHPAAG